MGTIYSVLIGLIGGVASGLFGVGGGVVFVPLLIFMKHFDPHLAIGTSLAIVVPTALMGAFRHGVGGMVDWKTALFIAVFTVLGAWIGAGVSLKLNVVLLKRVFSVFLVVMAMKLFFQD